MEDKKNTEVAKVVWPTDTQGTTTVGWKNCSHTGEDTILIGGIEVRLGGSPKITQAAIKASTLLISLNGQLPNMVFGQIIQFQYASLADRGGVPANWKEFVEVTANNMRNGHKLLFWCHGSHGRTGCLGASLIAVMEPEIEDPIAEIRTRHCKHAVESLAQAKAIFALKGLELPQKYEDEMKPFVSNYTGGSTTGYVYGPEPGPDGKDKEGKYYHHLMCKCALCLDYKTRFAKGQDLPCDCKGATCLWDGKARPATGPFAHCVKCTCGLCLNTRFHLVTYCECPDTLCKNKAGGATEKEEKERLSQTKKAEVVSIETGKHDWYCLCRPCIEAECSGFVCLSSPNCNCFSCVIQERKSELDFVSVLNLKHGRTNHPPKCSCQQCIQDEEDLTTQMEAVRDAEDQYDESYRYCMNVDFPNCMGDTDDPCKHMIEEDEELERAAAQLSLTDDVHGLDCQCQECWAKQPAYMF